MPVSMTKVEQQAPGLVSLVKKAQFAVSKHDLAGQVAKVALCLDHSGSMRALYASGVIQRTAERILAAATQFDDDGAIDVFVFDSTADHLGELSLADYSGGIDRLIGRRRMGTTDYAAAFRAVTEHYGFTGAKRLLGRSRATGDRSVPVYVAFLTDGSPDSAAQAERDLTAASQHPVFFQTVGLGREEFPFLEALDTLPGRTVDNAGYFTTPDIAAMGDLDLLDALLGEFPSYLAAARAAGVLT